MAAKEHCLSASGREGDLGNARRHAIDGEFQRERQVKLRKVESLVISKLNYEALDCLTTIWIINASCDKKKREIICMSFHSAYRFTVPLAAGSLGDA